MQQYLHAVAPLAMWVIALLLYVVTLNNDMPHKIDSVKTYQIQKKPHSFSDAWYNVKEAFSTYWPDDTCYVMTVFNTSDVCKAQRSTLVTQINTAMECTKYSSQMCSCIGEIMKGVKNPTSYTGKNLAGKKESVLFAVESCRWLMHNAHVSISSGKVWAQRTAILLLITTLVTGNAVDWILVRYMTDNLTDSMSKSMVRMVTTFFWGMLALAITVTVENNTFALFLLILLPPVLLLALYEIYLQWYEFNHRPFIHPYYFATILGALTLLAHVEVGVSDFDVIVFEILKCNVAAFLYLQMVWKYMIKQSKEDQVDIAKSNYVEDGTLRCVLLIFVLYFVGLWAPYTAVYTDSFMWYTPFAWVILGACSVIWICSFDYDSWFGDRVKSSKPKEEVLDLTPALKNVSALVLVFTFLLLMYYLRENSIVYRVLVDKFPPNSIQYNASMTWARAPVVGTSA